MADVSACPGGKLCFPVRESAEAAADRLTQTNQRRKEKGRKKRTASVYRCRLCGFWHLTSHAPKRVAP